MTTITLVILALGLAMDAFAVSVSNSMCYAGYTKKQATITSASFGFFQGLMPIIGFFAGRLLGNFIMAIDHWLALILLCIIGGKMVLDAIKEMKNPSNKACENVKFGAKTMALQAVATSIDALAVGVSLAALTVNIWVAAGLIASITFVCCLVGSALGRKFGALLGDFAQLAGGIILIAIGIKIFIEHMMGG